MTKSKTSPDLYAVRKSITFEQAEGVEPLPTQLQLKEVSPALRAAIWLLVYKKMSRSTENGMYGTYISGDWYTIPADRHVYRLHLAIDEFDSKWRHVSDSIKKVVMKGDYTAVFGFLQFVIRHPKCPYQFPEDVDSILKHTRAAYRVVDRTIVPIGSEAEQATIAKTFADLAATEFHGARQHLRQAAEELTAGHPSDSIRESIHAVESVVRILEPHADFSKALARLDAKVKMHGAMKSGFSSLYGFTSDEKGIRHPLLDKPAANVDEVDALFMIGACAAFISYLINKSRNAGLFNKE